MRRGIIRLSLVFLYLFVAPVANAQSVCGPHEVVKKGLADKYKETVVGIGTVDDQAIVEIFVSEKGTWTVIATDTSGMSCIKAAGDNWQFDTAAFDKAKKGEEM